MIDEILTQLEGGRRIVGVGPMSENSVEAIYRYSQDENCIIELIASRRQIECKALGRGYVNNWTTEQFGEHLAGMKKKYPKSRVLVCRDHGGPWQGYSEEGADFAAAMARAKQSYEADILSGFDILHIDPSVDGDGKLTLPRTLDAARELILHCNEFAKKHGKKIQFEFGTEENVGHATSSEVFEESLSAVVKFCEAKGIPKPLFVVGQTGSLVKEMRQVGGFDGKPAAELAECARKYGVFLKEHNDDYLSEYQMLLRDGAKIPAINVAPEFGVIESRVFVDMCMGKGRNDLVQRFIALSIKSGKWKKWVIDEKYAPEYDRGMIAGHYVFATPEFLEMRKEIGATEFDSRAQQEIYTRIGFYCRARGNDGKGIF
ncbi:MAG: tagatose-6-phosphate kinase [Candidatus Micrarchaeia archaeon]